MEKENEYIVSDGKITYRQVDHSLCDKTYIGYKTMFSYLKEFESGKIDQ